MILLLSTAAASRGGVASQDGLAAAAAARSMLGDGTWARLVRIDNSGPRRTLARVTYPRTVYALVFELSGVLWFYTGTDGTQSLSLTLATVERDEANPGPLFHSIDPGFGAWSWVEDPQARTNVAWRRPPNACFVESVAALYRRVAAGCEAGSPRLLSYYVDTPGGRMGHTVLLFETSGGLAAIDSDDSGRPVNIPREVGREPRVVSAYLRGGPISAARTFPIACARRPEGRWAALPSTPSPAG
jgi:hypothetical protein